MSDYKLKWNGQQVLKLSEKATERAITEIAIDVHREAVRLVPVDVGRLKGSIAYEANGNEGKVYTNVEYAVYVEFGTGIYAENGGGRKTPWAFQNSNGKWYITRGMEPRPYLRPASDKVRPTIPKIVQKHFKKELG